MEPSFDSDPEPEETEDDNTLRRSTGDGSGVGCEGCGLVPAEDAFRGRRGDGPGSGFTGMLSGLLYK